MGAGAPAGADLIPRVGMAEVAAMHKPTEAAKARIPAANIALATELSKARAEKQTAAQIIKNVAESAEGAQYESTSAQQDAARFGGEAGTLSAAGKVVEKPGITLPQKERLEKGQKAIERVSSVLFYTDILKLPEVGTARQDAINELNLKNPSFKALGINTVAELETKAIDAMFIDPNVQKLLAAMPDNAGVALTDADKKGIIQHAMLTNEQFRDKLSQNFQAAHDRLIKLSPVTVEGKAKLEADKVNADKTFKDKVAALKIQLGRTTNVAMQALDESKITAAVQASNSEVDFKKQIAIEIGVPAAHLTDIASIMEDQKKIADYDKKLTDPAMTGRYKELARQKAEANARITTARGNVGVDVDIEIAQYNDVITSMDQSTVAVNVKDAVAASIESAKLTNQIAGIPAGADISTNLDARLGQEDTIIRELNAILGKSLGQEWTKEMDEANALRTEEINKMIEAAGTDAEKKLIRMMETEYVEFDSSNRSTTIHGDRVMEGARLLTFKDRGLMLAMARDMELIPNADDEIEKILTPVIDKKTGKNTNDALAQRTAIDNLLSTLKAGSPEKYAVLEKALIDHGGEYRQKVYGAYLTMDDYIKEGGLTGIAIRFGRKIKYEGSPRGLMEKMTGKGGATLNYEELKELFMYCKPDIEAAVASNKDAKTFMRNMERKGMVGNPDMLKKLAFFLFVILGLATGGIGGGLGVGGMAGGLGAGVGAGLGAGAGAGLGALGNKGIDAMTV